MPHTTAPADTYRGPGDHLRLLWPQWQGAGAAAVKELAPEFPLGIARRGYALGTKVLEAILPPHEGPTATVPVTMSDDGLEERDGVEAKAVVLKQLASALDVIRAHDPARITTLGGECAVSVAPFAELARRYGDDLAVIWIDSHPDVATPSSAYRGYHAMAVTALTGHGDNDIRKLLPATVAADRLALVGLHEWTDDDFPNIAAWGIHPFSPDQLRATTGPLLDWLRATGCTRVAVHFDVDTIDSSEIGLGLGFVPGGLTSSEVRRIVTDIDKAADIVGLTIAEFIPRQVMRLQQILSGFPLLQNSSPAH
ncbi:arginase family protein [Streptomyces paludis]|uniref:Arginase family protein n=1 Tax=Streptomyces paludis TaxID=2282738 RepID=A0A345HJ74_9ACTN|nr:arginase family protein [Streptomyces paludis]AXG76748.1 arginase family protein [Streptomyces paludis]